MPHVTFVHGLSNKPEPKTLLSIWNRALSGSPVFKEGRLETIAIHHGFTLSKLNGKEGSYEANEGVGLQSLKVMLANIEKDLPDIP